MMDRRVLYDVLVSCYNIDPITVQIVPFSSMSSKGSGVHREYTGNFGE